MEHEVSRQTLNDGADIPRFAAGQIKGPLKGNNPRIDAHQSIWWHLKMSPAGKWRLILNLFSTQVHSINDNIDSDLCSVLYAGIDQAIALVLQLELGCQLAKLDLQSMYRKVLVHPDDCPRCVFEG